MLEDPVKVVTTNCRPTIGMGPTGRGEEERM